jgi:hypothetical protein
MSFALLHAASRLARIRGAPTEPIPSSDPLERNQWLAGPRRLASRPPILRAAIEKILKRKYGGAVNLDTIVDLLGPDS